MLLSFTSLKKFVSRRAGRLGWVGAAGGALLGLQACSTTGSQVEHWQMVDGRALQSTRPAVGAGVRPVAIVFYRDAASGPNAAAPINVYINGQYQASLVGNTYTQQSLCPGHHRLMAARDDVRRRYVSKDEGRTFSIGAESVQYFKVSEAVAGEVSITPATAQAASPSLRQHQTHTVQRVVRNGC